MLTDHKINGSPAGGEALSESDAARPVATLARPDPHLGKIDAKLIDNVGVTLEAYLGEARMTVAEVMDLKEDALVALDAALNQSVELRLNGVSVARGELVAVGEMFGVRLVEMAK